MNIRRLTAKKVEEAASQPTRELREMGRNLSFWLDGVHYPSEGGYLEYVVRSYLRRRIPKRFEISTGFISILEPNMQAGDEPELIRKVSRQFDILIWDADTYSPLFRADDFVIIMPESVRAIIEITKCLNTTKMREDLGKFDDLNELYSLERQRFRPYTAMLAFSSKQKMKKLLQNLERFYLYDSSIPISFRYEPARAKKTQFSTFALSNFIDSICILDQGLIKGKMEITESDPNNEVVRYYAHENELGIETSFGNFEKDIMLNLSQFSAEASGSSEPSVDAYPEFMHINSNKVCGSLLIEDWDLIFIENRDDSLPGFNAMEKIHSSEIPNVSNFVSADFTNGYPNPLRNIEYFGPNIWAFEYHPDNIFACGQYSNGSRIKSWRIFELNENRSRDFRCPKIEDKIFLDILKDIKATAWRDNP
jgi:hypothetical protein